MLGKLLAALLLMIGVGIVLQLTDFVPLAAIGAFLMLAAGAALGLGLLLGLVLALEGILFGARDRWHRFN